MTDTINVVVVGQTPPPMHGQARMLESLVLAPFERIRIHHVRMAFSRTGAEVGRFRLGKVLHLGVVLGRIVIARIRFRPAILYYPPAGPNLVPVLRDILLLTCTRWMFHHTVFHFHARGVEQMYERLPLPLKPFFRIAYHHAAVAIHLYEEGAVEARSLNPSRSVVVPNGVPDHAGEVSLPARGRGVLLYVGKLRESKGIMLLLDAVRQLRSMGYQCSLRLVGLFASETFRDEVEQFVGAHQLADHVELSGLLEGDALWTAYRTADIFCFPSHFASEAMPRSIIEAMQFSLPVVATAWRGIPELVEDGATGFLVEPHDVQAVVERVGTLLTDGERGRQMGQLARDRYLERFSLASHLAAVEEVLADVGRV